MDNFNTKLLVLFSVMNKRSYFICVTEGNVAFRKQINSLELLSTDVKEKTPSFLCFIDNFAVFIIFYFLVHM